MSFHFKESQVLWPSPQWRWWDRCGGRWVGTWGELGEEDRPAGSKALQTRPGAAR